MTGDITNLPPLSGTALLGRGGLQAAEILRLLQPLEGLIGDGKSASAEVLSLKQVDQDFQLLLKLTLENGRQATLPVSSSVPLSPGTSVNVTQATADTLSVSLQQLQKALLNSLTRIDTGQLPPGTLLQGKVLTSQTLPPTADTPALFRSVVMLLNSAQMGSSLSVDSLRPLPVGSLLTAQVQDSQALRFIALPDRLDQLALAQQLTTQQRRQGSLEGLLNALQNLPPPTPDDAATPLRSAIDQLLDSLPDIATLTDAKALAQALGNSGGFLESKILTGMDTGMALDLKANLLRLVAQTLPGLPGNLGYDDAAAANTLARAMPTMMRNALGMLGQVAPKVTASSFPLPSRLLASLEDEGDLEALLKLAAAAISRLQSHQLAGLEQSRTLPDGTQVTTWQMELPMRNAHDIVPLQVRLQREDPPPQDREADARDEPQPREQKEKLWRLDLAFDLEPIGPLQVNARLVGTSLSSQLWAERAASAQLIDRELGRLRERLVACGLDVSELECHQGTPPRGPRNTLEQRWIDENA